MTAPGSAGPRVTDKRRAEILHDAKEQPALLHTYSWFELADLLIEGASLRAQNERLREALEAVEWGPAPLIEGHSACSWCLGVGKHSRACLVRRALASTDTGETP